MLSINDLWVNYQDKEIIRDVDLQLKQGQLKVLMGPNGSGKSTLTNALIGNPEYIISKGKVSLDKADLLNLSTDKRVKQGLFVTFQNPVAIPGVSLTKLLRETVPDFNRNISKNMLELRQFAQKMKFSEGLLIRGLNNGFSGGEKKKIEILQALKLAKKFIIFDEIDTGLDIDSIKLAAKIITNLVRNKIGCLVITHYQTLVDLLKVDEVLIMVKGKIVKKGQKELVKIIEKKGYKDFT